MFRNGHDSGCASFSQPLWSDFGIYKTVTEFGIYQTVSDFGIYDSQVRISDLAFR